MTDALLLCALEDELDALLAILPGGDGGWSQLRDSSGYPYYRCSFPHVAGGSLVFVAARAADMGATDAAVVAASLCRELKPRCLAMAGLCAGRRDKVFLGDVIVADRLFRYDAGKLRAGVTGSPQILHDIQTYNLSQNWRLAVVDFRRTWLRSRSLVQRPLSLAAQERWLLLALNTVERDGGSIDASERVVRCPRWPDVLQRLRGRGFISRTGVRLVDKGRRELQRLMELYPDGSFPEDPPPRVHVGALGTGEKVVMDGKVFQQLEQTQRKILGLDMEALAVGVVQAYAGRGVEAIVVKAVQDYADDDKDDSFREFAAAAAADFLIGFLRHHLAPAAAAPAVRPSAPTPAQQAVPAPGAGYHPDHYVRRRGEEESILRALDAHKHVTIWGPLGFGKTWLLREIYRILQARGSYRLVSLSAALLDIAAFDQLLRQLGRQIVDGVDGDPEWVDLEWHAGGPQTCFEHLVARRVLPHIGPAILVVGIDQLDRLMRLPFCDAFLSMLREWGERSGLPPLDRFRLLTTVSTLPSKLDDHESWHSPWNNTELVRLDEGFSSEQVRDLARIYGLTFSDADLELIVEDVGGHPFLTSCVLYELKKGGGQLAQYLDAEAPWFSSHLRRLREELVADPGLARAWAQVRASPGARIESDAADDLVKTGLARRRQRGLWPRCALFERYPW